MTFDYPLETAKAIGWISDRREKSIDWNWPVLSYRNPDSECLFLPEIVAYQIWTILEHRGMVKRETFVQGETGQPFAAYVLNFSDESLWVEGRKIPSKWRLYFWFPIQKAFFKFPIFLVWVFSLVITASVTYYIEKWIDEKYPSPNKTEQKQTH